MTSAGPDRLSRVGPTDCECGPVHQTLGEDVGGGGDEMAGRPGDLAGLCGFTDPPGALVRRRSHQRLAAQHSPVQQARVDLCLVS